MLEEEGQPRGTRCTEQDFETSVGSRGSTKCRQPTSAVWRAMVNLREEEPLCSPKSESTASFSWWGVR